MVLAWAFAIVLVVLTVVIHYEALRLLWGHLEALQLPFRIRLRMAVVMLAIFVIHIAEMVLFAAGMYVATHVFGIGSLSGEVVGTFRDFLYFSVVSYTTLGLGDIFPQGALRLITGIEALIGLLMITWSASFTYLYMERFWRLGQGSPDDRN